MNKYTTDCVCFCASMCIFPTDRHMIKHDWVCVCVCENQCSGLAGQCSVQCRSEQRRPRPAQSQHPGNPCVFRSPGPYLMSLSKKKVALSRVFLSVSLSFPFCLSLFYSPSFSHAPPPPVPWSHFANEWTPSVYSATLSAPSVLPCSGQSRCVFTNISVYF